MVLFIPSHGGNISQEARTLSCKVDEIIDASASIVPFKTPKSINKCLKDSISKKVIRYYPDQEYQELKEAISKRHEIEPSMVIPGNGAAELITWAARDAAKQGISSIISPGFSEYKRALQCWEGIYTDSQIPLSLKARNPQPFPISPKTNVLWITNPHNPTGQLWERKSLERLLSKYNLVVCDEAFLSLVPNGEQESLLHLVNNHDNLIVIRSLTKLFAIAGLRLGYAVSNKKRLHEWERIRDPWPVNSLASSVGIMLMNDKKFYREWTDKIHLWVSEEGLWLHQNLEKIPGLISYRSSTNYQLIQGGKSLLPLRNKLAENKILTRDCRSFSQLGENWLRISLQTRKNNRRIIRAIREFI